MGKVESYVSSPFLTVCEPEIGNDHRVGLTQATKVLNLVSEQPELLLLQPRAVWCGFESHLKWKGGGGTAYRGTLVTNLNDAPPLWVRQIPAASFNFPDLAELRFKRMSYKAQNY